MRGFSYSARAERFYTDQHQTRQRSLTEFPNGGHIKPLFVRFDLSVFETSLSALCDQPRLGGCDLDTVCQWLSALGQHEVSAIMLTGLNPNRPGMGVVKVGQRLMVTALLAFIYARLGFGIILPGA